MSSTKDNMKTDPACQQNSSENSRNDQPLSHQDRYFKVWADIGEVIFAFISGEIFCQFATRIGLLIQGAWLPGVGDVKTIAALTNKSDRTIEDFVSDNPRTKYKVGRQVYYRLDEIATIAANSAEDAPAKRSGD